MFVLDRNRIRIDEFTKRELKKYSKKTIRYDSDSFAAASSAYARSREVVINTFFKDKEIAYQINSLDELAIVSRGSLCQLADDNTPVSLDSVVSEQTDSLLIAISTMPNESILTHMRILIIPIDALVPAQSTLSR